MGEPALPLEERKKVSNWFLANTSIASEEMNSSMPTERSGGGGARPQCTQANPEGNISHPGCC